MVTKEQIRWLKENKIRGVIFQCWPEEMQKAAKEIGEGYFWKISNHLVIKDDTFDIWPERAFYLDPDYLEPEDIKEYSITNNIAGEWSYGNGWLITHIFNRSDFRGIRLATGQITYDLLDENRKPYNLEGAVVLFKKE